MLSIAVYMVSGSGKWNKKLSFSTVLLRGTEIKSTMK